jgi:hypothetical protein
MDESIVGYYALHTSGTSSSSRSELAFHASIESLASLALHCVTDFDVTIVALHVFAPSAKPAYVTYMFPAKLVRVCV